MRFVEKWSGRFWNTPHTFGECHSKTSDGFFLKRERKSLLDLLSEKSPAIDPSQVKYEVEQNLASGKFQLIIAVDGMNPELEKVIAYISSRGTGLQLEALELELYRQGQVEILVQCS